MNHLKTLGRSYALWNRNRFDMESNETLAQILDRGSMDDWRALYALSASDGELRKRIIHLVARVPMYLPHFWLAAMRSLGENVNVEDVAQDDGMLD